MVNMGDRQPDKVTQLQEFTVLPGKGGARVPTKRTSDVPPDVNIECFVRTCRVKKQFQTEVKH